MKPTIDLMREQYDALPEAVRQYYTYEEYRWLPDALRARIEQSDTDPDFYDD